MRCHLIALFTATSVGVIVAAASLFTALLSTLGGDRRALNPWFFAGFIAAVAGLATVSMAGGGGAGADGAGANPLLGDFLAWVLIFGEPFTAPIIAGLLLTVGGLLLSQRGARFE